MAEAPRALRDLQDIEAYLHERSRAGARSVMRALKLAIDDLAEFPRIGVPIDNEERYRLPVGRYPYLIFYRIGSSEVFILHIRHGARRPVKPEDL